MPAGTSIYLDHAATTPLRREALEAMLPYLGEVFGNPSSPHAYGRRARAALDDAHERIARQIGATPREIVLTSGGTEALNLALKGAAWAGKARGHRIVTSAVEHHAVLHPLHQLEKFGFEIVEVPVDRYGRVDPAHVEAALNERTILVAIQQANNEVGTVQPIAAIGELIRTKGPKGCLFAVDAIAGAAYLPIDVEAIGCHLSPSPATRSKGRRARGRCTCGRGPTSCPSSRAAPRSATGGLARRTSRPRPGWPSPSSWPSPSGMRQRGGSASSGTASRPRCWPWMG